MKPYYQDLHNTLYNQDFRTNDLPDESVQMVCTSPPYWGLRKYAGDQDLIWGDNHCEHGFSEEIIKHDNLRFRGGSSIVGNEKNRDIHCVHSWVDYKTVLLHENRNFQTGSQEEVAAAGRELTHIHKYSDLVSGFCTKCGAWKGAYGLEPTPEMYVQHTIEILREIRRVLRKDGVVFWNIGDSYWGGKGKSGYELPHEAEERRSRGETFQTGNNVPGYMDMRPSDGKHNLIKPKDLCLIPFRVAIAAQEDGWWVRSVIIWSKPNPMPESVKDRPTESHEYILMLTKSARYYWDQEAVREAYSDKWTRWGGPVMIPTDRQKWANDATARERLFQPNEAGRNIRSVWTFPTTPYPEAHFAVFPEKLPELCIKAASKEGDLILDPLMGAGTTLLVAKNLNRKAIGFDISEEYCQLTVERCRQQVMDLATKGVL